MTILSTDNRRSYTGDGSTTVFSFPVRFLEDADVKVALRVSDVESSPVLDTDYTVSGAGDAAGGSVTFTAAPASDATVVIFADPSLTQAVDYQDNDEFPAETHERALDKLTLIVQRLSARIARTLQYDETAPEVLTATQVLSRVDDAETARDQAEAAQVSAGASQTASLAAQTASEIAQVSAEAAATSAELDAAAAATSATSAATDASAASASAMAADESSTSASASADSASTSQTNAAASEASASTSATNASSSEANAAGSATASSGSASTAETARLAAEAAAATIDGPGLQAQITVNDGDITALQSDVSGKAAQAALDQVEADLAVVETLLPSGVGGPFRVPKLTTAQRNAIASPSVNDEIYNLTTGKVEKWGGAVWDAAGGGGGAAVLISQLVADNSPVLTFPTLDFGVYDRFFIEIEGLIPSVSASIALQFSPDNGVTWRTSGYRLANMAITSSSTFDNFGSTSEAGGLPFHSLGVNPNPAHAGASLGGSAELYSLNSASLVSQAITRSALLDTNRVWMSFGGGVYDAAEAHNRVRIAPRSGNIASGVAALFGRPIAS